MNNIKIRSLNMEEVNTVAELIATGYRNDIFFHWVVNNEKDRHKIVTDYYKIYLRAKGCVAHVAETTLGEIVAAAVWLPHDVDTKIYDEMDNIAGVYAPNFRAVADMSHESEPSGIPFYQLVGFVVRDDLQGRGIGAALLKHHLDILDNLGIPTYLEASTPYHGKGVYGKFGYDLYGQVMVFSETAVLYPLWRPAKG